MDEGEGGGSMGAKLLLHFVLIRDELCFPLLVNTLGLLSLIYK